MEKKRLNLVLPEGLHVKLKAAAAIEFESMNHIIIAYIKLGLLLTAGELAIYHIEEDGSEIPCKVVL